MISVEEASRTISNNAAALETELVPLSEGLGRVLARDLRSDVDWPPFDTSAMDGYAVRLADLPAPLAEREKIVAAGDPPGAAIGPGETVRIMTGAPLPPGTEAVVPVERSRREKGLVRFDALPDAGAHIRRRGESLQAGALVAATGRRLTAGDIPLAAVAGGDPLLLFRRPRIAIAATGNELVPAAEKPRAGQLRDSNGPMLLALCRARGGQARLLPRVPDDRGSIERLFGMAGDDADVLVTCGGVSAGDLDLLPGIARESGFEILFHHVAVRPGKPVAFGRRGRTLWFGLPGNPVSASVGFHLFVRHALARLEGDAGSAATARLSARLCGELPPAGPRETYRDGLWSIERGVSRVEPLRSAGSHDIAAHARANALIRLPAGSAAMCAGSEVECLLLER